MTIWGYTSDQSPLPYASDITVPNEKFAWKRKFTRLDHRDLTDQNIESLIASTLEQNNPNDSYTILAISTYIGVPDLSRVRKAVLALCEKKFLRYLGKGSSRYSETYCMKTTRNS